MSSARAFVTGVAHAVLCHWIEHLYEVLVGPSFLVYLMKRRCAGSLTH